MSWSVNAQGKPVEVKKYLEEQFSLPLAEKPLGLSDDGERETVKRVSETIYQCLDTFGPDVNVSVSANGYISFDDYDKRTNPQQYVNVAIAPMPTA